jgi:hypothetical protein
MATGRTRSACAADGSSKGKRKRKQKAGPSAGTSALIEALGGLGLQLEAPVRAGSKVSKQAAEKASGVAAAAAVEGERVGVQLFDSTIEVPVDSFLQILKEVCALPSGYRHLLRSVQLVSKSWLHASREPGLITALDSLPESVTMTTLTMLLKQPRFSHVKRIGFSHKIKVGKTGGKALAQVAPHLTHIDMLCDRKNHPSAETGLEIAGAIPTLSSLGVDMWNFDAYAIACFARKMGTRLRQLQLEPESILNHYVSDYAMRALAQNCPNLRMLYIRNPASDHQYGYDLQRDGLTDDGVLAVLEGCKQLECAAASPLPARFAERRPQSLSERLSAQVPRAVQDAERQAARLRGHRRRPERLAQAAAATHAPARQHPRTGEAEARQGRGG